MLAHMSGAVAVEDSEELRIFNEHRGRLQAVAYRVLGRFSDAEDVVQDVDTTDIADPRAYLIRVTTRLAIDRLRSAQFRREAYVGPWLPEPVLTTPDIAENVALADSVSVAMLLVLENLSPLERAVFVLREAFDYSNAEIALMVDRGESAVRQIASRARQHVEQHRTRYDTDQATRTLATQRFLDACTGGDVTKLMEVLAPEVTLVSDGGGLAPSPRKAIRGAELVARALVTFGGRMPEDPSTQLVQLNGGPGIVVRSGGTPVVAISLQLVDGVIDTVYLVSNPEKLTGLRDPAKA
jgi:RNA polymerase sigma factor (sigma-70 family)